MNSALTHSVVGLIPLALLAVLAAMIYSRKGNHPATYTMSEPWTHAPVLWAATDEAVPHAHHGHGGPEIVVGGGASGKW